MADSYVVYTATANQTTFTVPFPYFEPADVQLQLNGITMLNPSDWTWLTVGSIKLRVGVGAGTTVLVRRQTSPESRLVAFNNGAVLTADDLNTAAIQAFYRTQEIQDQLDLYVGAGVARYSITGANPYVTPSDLLNAAADAVLATTLAQALLAATSAIGTNANDILAQTNRVNTLESALNSLTSGVPGGIGAYLTNETNARIAGDAALASTFALIGAVSGGGATFVLDTNHVYVDSVTSMADKFTGIFSTMAGNTSAITTEATTRASADATNASLITGLTSTVTTNAATAAAAASTNAAAIATEATTRANADSAAATTVTALTATVTTNAATAASAAATNAANITNEASVRASADSAAATTVSALTTTVNGNTASISTQATSINGLSAQYTVKVDVNGRVAGFGLASTAVNGATVSDFIVVANRFSIVDPGNTGGAATVPFSVSGGVVFMQNVVIDGALITNATIGTAKIANLAVGTAQIAANAATSTWATDDSTTRTLTPGSATLHSLYSAAASIPYNPGCILSFTADAAGTCLVTAYTTLEAFEVGTMSAFAMATSVVGMQVIRTDTNALVASFPANLTSGMASNYSYRYSGAGVGNQATATITLHGSFTAVNGVPYKVYLLVDPNQGTYPTNYYEFFVFNSAILAELVKK